MIMDSGEGEIINYRTDPFLGNPTARTLAKIVAAIREDLGYVPRVKVAMA